MCAHKKKRSSEKKEAREAQRPFVLNVGLLTESVDDGVPVVLPLGRPPQHVAAAAVPRVRRLHVGAPAGPLLADDLREGSDSS